MAAPTGPAPERCSPSAEGRGARRRWSRSGCSSADRLARRARTERRARDHHAVSGFAILVGAGVRRIVPAHADVRARTHSARPRLAGVVAGPDRARRQVRGAGAAHLRAARAGAVLPQPLSARSRHPDPDLRHARLGAEHRGRPRRPARSRLRRVLRGRRLFLCAARHRPSACRSGSACRSPASSRRSGASCSAFRCCGCAATISPSSRWRSARSSAWC